MKEAKTKQEARTAVDAWMQALESLPFIEWKQNGQWKIKAEKRNEITRDEARNTVESEGIRNAKSHMRRTIKECKRDPEDEEKEKEVAKAKRLYKQAKKIRMKKGQIKATSIERMIDCQDPTWWKHYKAPRGDAYHGGTNQDDRRRND